MKELIRGILDFRRRLRPKVIDLFKALATNGQSPDCIFMACSDSRVVPNLFASTNPGNLFVVRNVGNLVPKPNDKTLYTTADESEVAALEFGINTLGVKNIIVCGHSECGAMIGLLNKDKHENHVCDASCIHSRMPHLHAWLRHGSESLEKYREWTNQNVLPTFHKGDQQKTITAKISPTLSPHNQLSQINVIQQLQNLSQYNVVKEKIKSGEIELHGWWFDIANADVYSFSEKKSEYVLIDDAKASELLEDRFDIKVDASMLGENSPYPYWIENYLGKKK